MQHVLRAVSCPYGKKPVIRVLQRATTANRDKSGVAIFGKDHNAPSCECVQGKLSRTFKYSSIAFIYFNLSCQRPTVCGIVPEGDFPEWDRALALRAVALYLDRLDNQSGRGFCLGAGKTRSQKMLKSHTVPQHPVHIILVLVQDVLLGRRRGRCKCCYSNWQ
jgi:hypothetical protein